MTSFEDQYLDVLQNIEFAINSIYRAHPTLTDYEVDKVLNLLITEYKAQTMKREAIRQKLSPVLEELYESVKSMCEWRLGREAIEVKDRKIKLDVPKAITVEELIACLKRIRKSVEMWSKQGGRRGYLEFTDQFLG